MIINEKLPTDLLTSDFYYDLPEELIAQVPLEDRTSSRLMVVDKNNIVHQKYVTLGDVFEDKQVVLSGLNPTDNVIIQGLQKVSSGIKVNSTIVIEEK